MTHNCQKEEADKEVARYKANINTAFTEFNNGIIRLMKEAMLRIDGAFAPPSIKETKLPREISEKKDG